MEQVQYESEKSIIVNHELCFVLSPVLLFATGLFNQQVQYWPRFNENDPSPSIVVCTPAFLAHFIKGPNIQEVDLFRNVRHLVLDEVSHRNIFSLFTRSSLTSCKLCCFLGELLVSNVLSCANSFITLSQKADMLLEGSYLKDVEKIIDTFRLVRREMIHDGVINVSHNMCRQFIVFFPDCFFFLLTIH